MFIDILEKNVFKNVLKIMLMNHPIPFYPFHRGNRSPASLDLICYGSCKVMTSVTSPHGGLFHFRILKPCKGWRIHFSTVSQKMWVLPYYVREFGRLQLRFKGHWNIFNKGNELRKKNI